jgi:hypothetical protein
VAKISCPSIWWEKMLKNRIGCRDRFDRSQKITELVWFSGTSVRLISCWKTPHNAENSLSAYLYPSIEVRTFGCRLGCLRMLVMAWSACPMTYAQKLNWTMHIYNNMRIPTCRLEQFSRSPLNMSPPVTPP